MPLEADRGRVGREGDAMVGTSRAGRGVVGSVVGACQTGSRESCEGGGDLVGAKVGTGMGKGDAGTVEILTFLVYFRLVLRPGGSRAGERPGPNGGGQVSWPEVVAEGASTARRRGVGSVFRACTTDMSVSVGGSESVEGGWDRVGVIVGA